MGWIRSFWQSKHNFTNSHHRTAPTAWQNNFRVFSFFTESCEFDFFLAPSPNFTFLKMGKLSKVAFKAVRARAAAAAVYWLRFASVDFLIRARAFECTELMFPIFLSSSSSCRWRIEFHFGEREKKLQPAGEKWREIYIFSARGKAHPFSWDLSRTSGWVGFIGGEMSMGDERKMCIFRGNCDAYGMSFPNWWSSCEH